MKKNHKSSKCYNKAKTYANFDPRLHETSSHDFAIFDVGFSHRTIFNNELWPPTWDPYSIAHIFIILSKNLAFIFNHDFFR